MRRDYVASEKLQKQLDEYNNTPIVPGDIVDIAGKFLKRSSSRSEKWIESCKVKDVEGNNIIVFNGYNDNDTCIVARDKVKKNTFKIGANPFSTYDFRKKISLLYFSLDGIILMLFKEKLYTQKRKNDESEFTIEFINWNPYVYNNKGEREYYQRDFCWSLKDKQLFIDSIYNHINCGQVLARLRSDRWIKEEGEKEDILYLYDIVDGKQRLHTIYEFINNQFADSYGNYWNDLSEEARRMFENSRTLTFAQMDESTTDQDVINAFLHVNFTGVPMSYEHIEYIKELNKRM